MSSGSVAGRRSLRSTLLPLALAAAAGACTENQTVLQAPTVIEGFYDVAGTVISVHAFGAVGDGEHDDTRAIQDAIDMAESRPQGGAVYLPPGVYLIGGDTGRGTPYLTVQGSNVTVFGHGDQSVLRIRGWSDKRVRPGYVVVGSVERDVSNVRFRDFRIEGELDADRPAVPDEEGAAPSAALLLGADSPRYVVSHSGFERVHAVGVGGAAFAFGHPVSDPEATEDFEWPRAFGNFALHNRVEGSASSAIASYRRGQSGSLISDNVIDRVGGTGIQWWGTQATICRNGLSHVEGSGIVLDWAPRADGWTLVLDNNLYDVGGFGGTDFVGPAIQVGQHRGVSNVLVGGNTARALHGSGIVLEGRGDSRNVVVRDNVIDGFGVGARGRGSNDPNGVTGISVLNATQLYVLGNIVRASTGPDDLCRFGFVTGGSIGIETWTDRNVATGPFEATAFYQGMSTAAGGGERNRVGTNVDLGEGRVAAPTDGAGHAVIPTLSLNDASPTVAGSDVWRVEQAAPAVIQDLLGGAVGRSVTLLFEGAPTTLRDSTGGPFRLREDFVSTPGSTLVLLRGQGAWHELSRSLN